MFVLAFDNTDGNANQVERNSHGKYFPQRVDITKYNVLIDGRNFYILLKGVTKTIKNERKEQKGGFLSMLLGTLGSSLLGNLLSGKGTVRAGEGIVRAGYGSSIKRKKALIAPHPLKNF